MKKSELKALIREVVEEANRENPCWKGYKAYGTKKKDGKTVPNCAPIKEGNGLGNPQLTAHEESYLKKNGFEKKHDGGYYIDDGYYAACIRSTMVPGTFSVTEWNREDTDGTETAVRGIEPAVWKAQKMIVRTEK